jgi:TRAP-type mannitol/chloroaromatic compound transport system substrate-binding protein
MKAQTFRRTIAKPLGSALAGAALVASLLGGSLAQAAEQWSMATPWAGDPIYDRAAKGVARDIGLFTGGAITVEVFPGGTLGKALKVTDTVAKGIAQIGHNWSGYDWGIDRTSIVFGGFAGTMPPDLFHHWLFQGDGAALWMEWRTTKFNVAGFPCSMGPREVFLHSHKRVVTLADFQGMKVRTAGAWAEIAQTLGASTVIMAGSEVYPALERKVDDGI